MLGLGLAWGLLGAGAAQAQSLQELYQAALGYDAAYLSTRASLDAAQYRRDQQYALRRPNVGLTVSGGRSLSRTCRVAYVQAPGAALE